MVRAILLPGMDGTGELLAEFAAALAPELEATIVAYPGDIALDYPALTALVARSLPSEGDFVLIAESFSGPIAIELAATRPEGLIGLVLCASFARAPRPRMLRLFMRLQRVLPVRRLPVIAIMPFLMGRWSSRQWRQRVRDAISDIDASVLRGRLRAAATVDATARIADIDCPLIYLRARDDWLIDADSWLAIRAVSNNAVCIEIEGPHMLLQARPDECAAAIK